MALKYVSDFTFAPSPPRPTIQGYARGGHVKASTPFAYKNGGLAKGHGNSNDAGHAGKNSHIKDNVVQKHGGIGDGKVKYYANGGLAKGKGLSNDKGHSGPNSRIPDNKVQRTKGIGDGDVKRAKVSPDIKKSVSEKSSGVQKPAFAKGGKVAGKIPVKDSGASNPGDASSPGSFKRTPVGQAATNKSAANSKFDGNGRNTPVATKQAGNVERMAGYSDFKNGGRIKNLGHYAHGGKVKAPVNPAKAGKYESHAGTPKTSPGTRVEMKSGVAKAAMGGLSRGTSPKKNAAIHAKNHAPKAPKGMGALGQAMPPMGAPQGPPPGMGAPMGAPMGAGPPPGAGGPPMMKSGGGVKHVIVHHVSHR